MANMKVVDLDEFYNCGIHDFWAGFLQVKLITVGLNVFGLYHGRFAVKGSVGDQG
jgi:uncharacterized membrane protein